MNKTLLALIGMICLSAISNAHSLSTYPDLLKTNNHMDAIIVVGDKAGPTHVIAQTQIALSLTNEAGAPIPGLTRLASEVKGSIGNINVISIGNACDNPLSAEILGNPQPCSKGLDKNVARIESYGSQNGKHHLVLNAYGDAGIKKLAHVLVNYDEYSLGENVFEIEVDNEKERVFETAPQDVAKDEDKTKISEEDEKDSPKEIKDNTLTLKPAVENTTSGEGELIGSASEPEPVLKDEDNFILKIINWFRNLFR